MDGLAHYRALFGTRASDASKFPRRHNVDRSSLPSPREYLAGHGLLTAAVRREWAQIKCPRHKGGDERRASMGVSLVDGHFRCHACGASGRDVIDLHRLATGMGFLAAVADLGGRFHD